MGLYNRQRQRGLQFAYCLLIAASLVPFCGFGIGCPRAQEPDEVIRVRTDLVAVPVIVTDSHGHRVANLQPAQFTIKDDRGPIKIDYFASGTERVALLFALDASGSARATIGRQREAALALFARFGAGSRVAVLHFADFVTLTVPFTTNSDAAFGLFSVAAKESLGTAIFDGAAAAVHVFDGSGGFSMERRIVILMSDGLDTLGSTKYEAVIDAAHKRGVSFYVIHFPIFSPREGRLEPRPPVKGFRELAEATGGRYFRIGDVESALNPDAKIDLAPVFKAIENDLRGQYVLGFYPGKGSRDNRFHPVTVGLAGRDRRLRVQQFLEGYDLKP